MRWTATQAEPSDVYHKAFAFFPTPMTVRAHKDEWVWLESYEWRIEKLHNGRWKILRRPLGSSFDDFCSNSK